MNYLPQGEVRVTEAGLFIPHQWLTGLTENLCIRRFQQVLIIETSQHAKAREQLVEMVGKLRQVTDEMGGPDEADIVSLVKVGCISEASYTET